MREEGPARLRPDRSLDLARALVVARITAEEPGISARDPHVRLFERLYATDFDPVTLQVLSGRLRARR